MEPDELRQADWVKLAEVQVLWSRGDISTNRAAADREVPVEKTTLNVCGSQLVAERQSASGRTMG